MTILFYMIPVIILGLYLLGARMKIREAAFQKALRDGPFPYVYVEKDGSVRELYEDEKEYLLEEFSPMDSGRPYIKYNYRQLTPDKKIHGFLRRRDVPRRISILAIDPHDKTHPGVIQE